MIIEEKDSSREVSQLMPKNEERIELWRQNENLNQIMKKYDEDEDLSCDLSSSYQSEFISIKKFDSEIKQNQIKDALELKEIKEIIIEEQDENQIIKQDAEDARENIEKKQNKQKKILDQLQEIDNIKGSKIVDSKILDRISIKELQEEEKKKILEKQQVEKQKAKSDFNKTIVTLLYVIKFLNLLKSTSSNYLFYFFTQKRFLVFNDSSVEPDYYIYETKKSIANPYILKKNQTFLGKIIYYIKKNIQNKFVLNQLEQTHVILPDSFFKIFWDSIIWFLLIANLFYIPMKMSFEGPGETDMQLNENLKIFLDTVPGWAFLLDIAFNFNTAYYKEGILETNKKKIYSHYVRESLLVDVLVIVPFVISINSELPYLDMILFLRTNKMIRLAQSFEEMWNLSQEKQAIYDLFKIVFLIIFIAHFCGCAFYFFYTFEQQKGIENNWVQNKELQDASWEEKYINSLYWAVITMITVGYGDVVPVNHYEKVFVMFITLISCGVFAYSINAIGTTISDMNKRFHENKSKLAQLSNHMKKRGLSNKLQLKVKKYYGYFLQQQDEDNEIGEDMINNLTQDLKSEVQMEIYFKILNEQPTFNKFNFSEPFVRKLSLKVKEKSLTAEILFNETDKIDKMYILMSGTAHLFVNKKDNVTGEKLLIINQDVPLNTLLGQQSFFSGLKNQFGVLTPSFASFVYISKEDFLSVIKDYQEDFEKYCQIMDNLRIYGRSQEMGSFCQFCKKFRHQMGNCPMINMVPNSHKVLGQFSKNEVQQRRFLRRRQVEIKMKSSLLNHQGYKQIVTSFLLDKKIPELDDEEILEIVDQLDIQDQLRQPLLVQSKMQPQNQQFQKPKGGGGEEEKVCSPPFPRKRTLSQQKNEGQPGNEMFILDAEQHPSLTSLFPSSNNKNQNVYYEKQENLEKRKSSENMDKNKNLERIEDSAPENNPKNCNEAQEIQIRVDRNKAKKQTLRQKVLPIQQKRMSFSQNTPLLIQFQEKNPPDAFNSSANTLNKIASPSQSQNPNLHPFSSINTNNPLQPTSPVKSRIQMTVQNNQVLNQKKKESLLDIFKVSSENNILEKYNSNIDSKIKSALNNCEQDHEYQGYLKKEMIDFELGTNFKSYFTWNHGNPKDALLSYNTIILKNLQKLHEQQQFSVQLNKGKSQIINLKFLQKKQSVQQFKSRITLFNPNGKNNSQKIPVFHNNEQQYGSQSQKLE